MRSAGCHSHTLVSTSDSCVQRQRVRHPVSGLCGFYVTQGLEKQILDHTLHRASDHGVRGVKTRKVSNSMETNAGWAGYDVIRLRYPGNSTLNMR
jgi:hypothetical protein